MSEPRYRVHPRWPGQPAHGYKVVDTLSGEAVATAPTRGEAERVASRLNNGDEVSGASDGDEVER